MNYDTPTTKARWPVLIRIAVLISWAVLFGLLLKRDYFIRSLNTREAAVLRKDREESFSGVYFHQKRIGYVKNRLVPKEQGYELNQEAVLRLNILGKSHPVNLKVRAGLSKMMQLKDFDFALNSPLSRMRASGTVTGQIISFRLTTGKETISDSIRLKSAPFISSNMRGYLLEQNLAAGDKVKIPYFDPISLTGKDTVMEYQGYDKIVVRGRVERLHHFVQTFAGMKINSWLNENGRVIKEESPAGFTFIAEPEFLATDLDSNGDEILSAVSIKPNGEMPANLTKRKSLNYLLDFPEEAEVELDSGRQRFRNGQLTVTRETIAPDSPACDGPAAALAATPYIQADNSQVTELAEGLIGPAMSEIDKVRTLAEWVYNNLEKRPVLGIPDALSTLSSRKGDCNEHAALFAALARSVGIPTRVAAGVTFHAGAFYYHAWNEVCLGGRWISLDTTKNQLPADLSHIKFIQGEIGEMIKIGALLGRLAITIPPEAPDEDHHGP